MGGICSRWGRVWETSFFGGPYTLSYALIRKWDVLSGVSEMASDDYSGMSEMAWDVLSGVSEMASDVLSGVTKTAWECLSGVANLCGMFCLGCQKMAWDVLFGVANLCGMFCLGCQKMAWDVLSQDVLSGSLSSYPQNIHFSDPPPPPPPKYWHSKSADYKKHAKLPSWQRVKLLFALAVQYLIETRSTSMLSVCEQFTDSFGPTLITNKYWNFLGWLILLLYWWCHVLLL